MLFAEKLCCATQRILEFSLSDQTTLDDRSQVHRKLWVTITAGSGKYSLVFVPHRYIKNRHLHIHSNHATASQTNTTTF